VRIGLKRQRGQAVHGAVDAGHPFPKHMAQRHAQHQPHAAQQQRHARVVAGYGPVAVAKGFQQADVGPLGGHQPRQRDVEQKRRHRQKNGRQRGRHVAQLRQLFGQKTGRHHAVAPEGFHAAVGRQPVLKGLAHGRVLCRVGEGQHRVVEGTVHVQRPLQLALAHPQHADAGGLREWLARCAHKHKLGRIGHTHQVQPLALAAHHHVHVAAGGQAVGLGKGLVHQRLALCVALGPAARHQQRAVDAGQAVVGQRHQLRR
jgi:hypothetical protein